MEINFVGGAYKTFSPNVNAQECINLIPVLDSEGTALRGFPGLKEWVDIGIDKEVRGMKKMGRFLYVVVSDRVYQLDKYGASTLCTGRLSTTSGALPESTMAENGTQLMIVDGRKGYIVTDTTISEITDSSFPGRPNSVTFQDTYFIASFEGTGYCYPSALNDGTDWDATDRFIAHSKPDDTLCVFSHHRELSVFGEQTLESWYNSGSPFSQRPGATQEIGLGASKSPVLLDNAVFYLTNHNQVVSLLGNSPQSIFPPSVEYQISKYKRTDDAFGISITNIEGHSFYILTFPDAEKTWGYDVITKQPFQIQSYPEPYNRRWKGNCYTNFSGKHLVGDYENGKIYELDFDTYDEDGVTIRRVRTAPSIKKEGKFIFHHYLEVFFEPGTGLYTGQGSDPMVALQYSDDGGHEWSSEIWRSVGKIGKYKWRAVWHRLGNSRDRNYRIIMTDPVKWVITGANLEATIGAS